MPGRQQHRQRLRGGASRAPRSEGRCRAPPSPGDARARAAARMLPVAAAQRGLLCMSCSAFVASDSGLARPPRLDIAPQMCSYGAALLLRRVPSPAYVHAVSAGVGLCAFEEGLDVESVERGRCPGVGRCPNMERSRPSAHHKGGSGAGRPCRPLHHLCLASYFVARHHSLLFASLSCLLGQPDYALVVRAV